MSSAEGPKVSRGDYSSLIGFVVFEKRRTGRGNTLKGGLVLVNARMY